MAMRSSQNDNPIEKPSEDRFEVDPLAKRLAHSIRKINAPEGTVIALNGSWGSGKSSIINLILHHLGQENDEITIINFACWWFRGEDQLALAFFRELYAGLGPTLGEKFKKLLPKIGARLLRTGSMVGSAADVVGAHGTGSIAAAAMNWLSGLIQEDETVEKLHKELIKALSDQEKRFLIVIDDIDRLAPDEALLMFRLVKSVGRLPNVIYLLDFDRQIAEQIVNIEYPSEGPHFLEKIIQASFDIPYARQDDLRRELLEKLGQICGHIELGDQIQFMNTFFDVIVPEIRTPRDLVRLTNNLAVTWAAIGDEVYMPDFLGLETLRLLQPKMYRALHSKKGILTKTIDPSSRKSDQQRSDLEKVLLSSIHDDDKERMKRALTRLFPPLASVWANTIYGDHSKQEWSRLRRACSEDHFDSYFRFTIGDILPKRQLTRLIKEASDQEFITSMLRDAVATKRSGGGTNAALILDELNLHASDIPTDHVQPLLTAIFKLSDELNVPDDEAKAFSIGDNRLRIHWLMRRLTERFDLANRSQIFVAAIGGAPLAWTVDFTTSAYEDHHPREGKAPEPPDRCLTTDADATFLHEQALARLRQASASCELKLHPDLAYLLYRWRELAKDGGEEVRNWTSAQLVDDSMVAVFAKAFTSHGWLHSGDDRVSQRTTLANVQHLDVIIDTAALRNRIEELFARTPPDANVVEFLTAWRREEGRTRRA